MKTFLFFFTLISLTLQCPLFAFESELPVTQISISSVPGPVFIQCSDEIPTNNPFASTDCGNGGLTRIISFSSQINGCVNVLTKTWTYTNPCGDEEVVTQIITIEDTLPPTIYNLPPDQMLPCGSAIPPVVAPSFYDNCAELNVAVSYAQTIEGDECPIFVIRTWIATDYCGLTSTHVQTVQIGESSVDCPILELNIGDSCDDGDSNTENDEVAEDCTCLGSVICPGDFNGDGEVGIADFLQLNSLFGSSCTCPEDMNGNGQVDIQDFIAFNSSLGGLCGSNLMESNYDLRVIKNYVQQLALRDEFDHEPIHADLLSHINAMGQSLEIKIYPTIVDDILTVEWNNTQAAEDYYEFSIQNTHGTVLWSKGYVIDRHPSQIVLDINPILANGIYMLSVVNGQKHTSLPFFVK